MEPMPLLDNRINFYRLIHTKAITIYERYESGLCLVCDEAEISERLEKNTPKIQP